MVPKSCIYDLNLLYLMIYNLIILTKKTLKQKNAVNLLELVAWVWQKAYLRNNANHRTALEEALYFNKDVKMVKNIWTR